jgi:hypothetical protein
MPAENLPKDLPSFRKTLTAAAPPAGLAPALAALWWVAKKDWPKAHEIAQAHDTEACAWVHAHLHRVEGDLGNAGYWYRRARKPLATGATQAEWAAMVQELLATPT